MSIRWYKTFIAVARYGSFAAAAQQIGLTQAAISIQMSSLEGKLRFKLFDRSARTTALNSSGRALVPRAQELVNLYDYMGNDVDSLQLAGVLALGAIPPTFSQLLPDALMRLRQAHPGIEVRVWNGVSSELLVRVEQGELDAALVSEPPVKFANTMHWITVMSEPLVLLTPAAAKLEGLAATLASHPFIGVTHTSWTGQRVQVLVHRHRLKVNMVMELDSLEAIANMVARGFGVALLPLSAYIRGLGNRVRASLLTEPEVSRDIGLIHRKGQGDQSLIFALRDCLVAMPKERSPRLRRITMNS